MSQPSVEDRLETLESQVAELQSVLTLAQTSAAKDWRRALEKYAGDRDLQRVFAAAMKLREANRKRSRPRPARRKSR